MVDGDATTAADGARGESPAQVFDEGCHDDDGDNYHEKIKNQIRVSCCSSYVAVVEELCDDMIGFSADEWTEEDE